MFLPVNVVLDVEPDGEFEFTVTQASLSHLQDMDPRKVNEQMDDDTHELILEKLREG